MAWNADAADVDAVIHSGALQQVAPTAELGHRGLYLLFLALPVSSLGEVETWYTPEGRFRFGRVAEIGNYSESLRRPGETALCVEIPEGRWGHGHDFVADLDVVVDELQQAGIVPRNVRPVEAAQFFLPEVYPLYTRGWPDRWQQAMATVTGSGRVLPVGRQGLYLHCNIDHAMTTGRAAAEHLVGGGGARSWPARAARWLDVRVRD